MVTLVNTPVVLFLKEVVDTLFLTVKQWLSPRSATAVGNDHFVTQSVVSWLLKAVYMR